MNNKGQSLIIFIIILPIIFASLAFVFDYSLIIYNQNRLESLTKSIINTTTDSEDIKELYAKNNVDITNYKCHYNVDDIVVENTLYIKSVFGNLINKKEYKIEVKYIVSRENNDIIKEVK